MTEPTDRHTTGTPTATPPEPRAVRFGTDTGATVEATLYGQGSCGVVMIPQINLDRGSWHPQAELLAARGMVALPIDEGSQRVAATLAATEYLRTEHGVDQVILLGASSGGEAAIVAGATAPDRVDGVITLSAAGGVDHAASLTGQQLFVVSRADEQRFVDVTDTLGDTVASSRTVSYDGSAHGQALFAGPHRQDLWTHVHTLTTTVC